MLPENEKNPLTRISLNPGKTIAMNDKNNSMKILEKLERIEETISEIYRAFAEMFPDYRGFWSLMAEEERVHAGWVRKLGTKVNEGSLFVNSHRFPDETLRFFLKSLGETLERIRGKRISMTQAVELAMDLETSLIEKRLYEAFEGDPILLKGVFMEMREQIKSHFRRLGSVRKGQKLKQKPKDAVTPSFHR